MGVELIKDENNRYTGYFLANTRIMFENIKRVTGLENLKLNIYHSAVPLSHHRSMQDGRFFTDNMEYLHGRYELYNSNDKVGIFTISCFPNCCGMGVITGNYSNYSTNHNQQESDLTLLIACYLSQKVGNFKAAVAIGKEGSSIDKLSYINCGFKPLFPFIGNGFSSLMQYTRDLSKDDILKQMENLYESDKRAKELTIKKAQEEANKFIQDTDKKQASKPRTPKKLIAITEEESGSQARESNPYDWDTPY